jgi:hypothetical protein
MTKETLIDRILGLELEMFLSVSSDGTTCCQQNPEAFRLHRRAQFQVWSADTLSSYCNDLEQAKARQSNLMTLKYARMQNLITCENFNPLIQDIEAIQIRWQQELMTKYPRLMAGSRPLFNANPTEGASFEMYLRCELETYSSNTLRLLHRDFLAYLHGNVNASERVYEYLVRQMGYGSLEEADKTR